MVSPRNISKLYFKWLYKIAMDKVPSSYKQLLQKLFSIEYYYILETDESRAKDGEHLRYRFGREHSFDDFEIESHLDISPCSVLEMMVALALRCEEEIMYDSDYGNRTSQWFFEMLESLKLDSMDDEHFDEKYVEERICIFLNTLYKSNGSGSLFTVPGTEQDMRQLDIWYQLMAYLNYISKE